MRISKKLLLYNLLSKGLILLVFLTAAPFLLKYFAFNNTDNQLFEKKNEVLGIISERGMDNFITDDDPSIGFGSYNILKEEYILLELWQYDNQVDTIFVEDRILEKEKVTYRVYSHTFKFDENTYILEIGRSIETIKDIESILFNILIVTLIIFLVLTSFLDSLFTEKILRPFKRIITNKLSQIHEPQQFPYLPETTTTDEFKLLDESITEMMGRIQKSFNQEREFISHASHELKTPISILQTKVEALFSSEEVSDRQMEKLMDMQLTIQKMKKTVNALLLISKVNNTQFLKSDSFNVNKIIADLKEESIAYAEDKDIALIIDQNEDFVLSNSNLSLCNMMIQNALINALKYTTERGEIRLSGHFESGRYSVNVKDTGPGISDELLKQVKDGIVFLKDVEKDKSGFGLQIMYKIALYLGIEISIKSSSNGTNVSFLFPISEH
ncbi:sensor histidine kinase [Belliella aquatica]|uniref:histidine kinase n=1 Tax=Belliella aquatica TaxID=1323734 RepID=A0ABQ1N3T3_9BACT|nr:HAMP domain-containing sensor histidine kinase [Belliella aquatica]MCH7404026.1 HAMP domain-containing histidine kinase [Belliella aquatica]GGC49783.1 two-component sensor histidine kinase [Belliella aquatica]